MAGAHRASGHSRRKAKQHKKAHRKQRVGGYAWLGAGTITLGIGAALASGAGVAYADSTGSEDDSSSSATSSDTSASSEKATGPKAESSSSITSSDSRKRSESSKAEEPKNSKRAAKGDGESEADDSGKDTDTSSIDTDFKDNDGGSTDDLDDDDGAAERSSVLNDSATRVEPVSATTMLSNQTSVMPADEAADEPEPPLDPFAALVSVFFNGSPTTKPVQIRQSPDGIVTGNVGGSDPDRDPLKYNVISGPSKGTVVVKPDGTYTYTPDADFAGTGGTDTFTARVGETNADEHVHGPIGLVVRLVNAVTFGALNLNDGRSVDSVVTVTLTPVNRGPVVKSTVVGGADPDSGVVVGAINATDPDGDELVFSGPATTAKGRVVLGQDGVFTYSPTAAARHAASAEGAAASVKRDAFTVTVSDGRGGSTDVRVVVAVAPHNAAPTATATVNTPNASSGVVTGSVIAVDQDKDSLTYEGSTTTPKGKVVLKADGSFTYTPTAEARHAAAAYDASASSKKDSFTVTVGDGHGGDTEVVVVVAVRPRNAAPTATVTVNPPNATTGVISGSMNGVDADGDPLSYTPSSIQTSKGKVVVSVDGTFTYTASARARHAAANDNATAISKQDSFTIDVNDLHGGVISRTIVIDVPGANRTPTVAPTVGDPTPTKGTIRGTVGASDGDGDTLTFALLEGPTRGSVVVDPVTGVYIYTPRADERLAAYSTPTTETDQFSVAVTDGYGGTTMAVIGGVAVAPMWASGESVTIEGQARGPLVYGSDGKLYQTTSGNVAIIDPDKPADFTVVDTPGSNVGSATVGREGKVYQTSQSIGADGTGYITHVTIFDANDPSDPITIHLAGQASGGVVVGTDGTAYLVTQRPEGSSGNGVLYRTYVTVIDPDDVDGSISVGLGGLNGSDYRPEPVVAGQNGFAYLTTRNGSSSQINVFDPADPTHPTAIDVSGHANSPVVVGPDGTAYQTTYGSSEGTVVTVIDPENLGAPVAVAVPGGASYEINYFNDYVYRGVSVGSDGTAYQMTRTTDRTYLTVIDPDDAANPAVIEIAGTSRYDGLVVASDGRAYVTTRAADGSWTKVTLVDSTGVRAYDLPGKPAQYFEDSSHHGVVAGPNGVAYQVTYTPNGSDSFITHVTRLTPEGSTTVDSPNFGGVQFGPDGTEYAFASTSNGTRVTITDPEIVAGPIGVGVPGSLARPMVFGQNGIAYASFRPFGSDDLYVSAIDPSNSIPLSAVEITGDQIVGAVLVSPEGTAYVVTYTVENNSTTLSKIVIAPPPPAFAI